MLSPNSYDYWDLSKHLNNVLWTKFRKVSFWMSTIPSKGDYILRFPMLRDKYSIIDESKKGNLQKVKWLIKWGANVNVQDSYGQTALMFSACRDYLDVCKVLVESGAYINVQSVDGFTALMFAAISGHLDVVKVLVKSGADVNIKNQVDMTALLYSVIGGHLDCVKYLIENGADVNIQNVDGYTALTLSRGQVEEYLQSVQKN